MKKLNRLRGKINNPPWSYISLFLSSAIVFYSIGFNHKSVRLYEGYMEALEKVRMPLVYNLDEKSLEKIEHLRKIEQERLKKLEEIDKRMQKRELEKELLEEKFPGISESEISVPS